MENYIYIKSLYSGQWLAFDSNEPVNFFNGYPKSIHYFKIPKNGRKISKDFINIPKPKGHYNLIIKDSAKKIFGGNHVLDIFNYNEVPKWIQNKFFVNENKSKDSKLLLLINQP